MLNRFKKIALFLLWLPVCAFATADLYSLTPAQQKQFQQLTYELRCLVCQNQNLADSNAPLAIDLRNKIVTLIAAHQTNQDIKDFLVTRYSTYILYKPPLYRTTFVLWILPFLLFSLAVGMVLWMVKRQEVRSKC